MNTRFFLTFYGYTIHPSDPGFASKKEARAAQTTIIKEDMAAARRKWKSAFLFRSGDSFSIHAAQDKQSALWSAGSIVAA